MRQTLFTVLGTPFHAYPVMISVAFVVCTLLAVREGDRKGLSIPPEGGILVFIGALIGARAFYIVQYENWHYVWQAVMFWQAGLVFYGGLMGATFTAYLMAKWYKLPPIKTADLLVPYVALGEAITRIGCFLNGCCFGAPTDMPWGVRFPQYSYPFWKQVMEELITEDASASLPVHPTQLYMALGLGFVVFPLLKMSLGRQRFDGQTMLGYGLLYGMLRFIVEIFRGESAKSVMGMTVSQTISLILALFSIVLLGILYRLNRDFGRMGADASPDAEVPAPDQENGHNARRSEMEDNLPPPQ